MSRPDQPSAIARPPAEPLGLLRRWLGEAAVPGGDPPAAVLATVSGDAQPTTRAIEVRACDDRGLVFFANLHSRKGRDLRAHPVAAATLYWPAPMRQVNLSGPVSFTGEAESDRLWATRSRWGRAVATVSEQGAPLPDEAALRARAEELAAEPGRPLPSRRRRAGSASATATAGPTGRCSRDQQRAGPTAPRGGLASARAPPAQIADHPGQHATRAQQDPGPDQRGMVPRPVRGEREHPDHDEHHTRRDPPLLAQVPQQAGLRCFLPVHVQ